MLTQHNRQSTYITSKFAVTLYCNYYIVPCHAIPYHTPYHIIAHHSTPNQTTSHHTIPYLTILYQIKPWYTTPHCAIPYQIKPRHITPHHTIPYWTMLYYAIFSEYFFLVSSPHTATRKEASITVEQQNTYQNLVKKAGTETSPLGIDCPDAFTGSQYPSHTDVHESYFTQQRIQVCVMFLLHSYLNWIFCCQYSHNFCFSFLGTSIFLGRWPFSNFHQWCSNVGKSESILTTRLRGPDQSILVSTKYHAKWSSKYVMSFTKYA